jgi:hypothetical protein
MISTAIFGDGLLVRHDEGGASPSATHRVNIGAKRGGWDAWRAFMVTHAAKRRLAAPPTRLLPVQHHYSPRETRCGDDKASGLSVDAQRVTRLADASAHLGGLGLD